MKIKKILLSIAIVLTAVGVFYPVGSLAQQGTPPTINVSLALTNSQSSYLPGRLVYLWDDPIRMVITLENKEAGQVITAKGFPQRPFHLLLIFTGPDGRTILTHDPGDASLGDSPPPKVIPVQGQLKQVDLVESLAGGQNPWILSITIPNARAYYTLTKTGNYSVKALIPMRTYKTINYPGPPENYSEIDDFKWSGALSSNTERFILLTDADGDGYYYPEGYPSGTLADCNDNDPKEKPGQTWYKDADDDGYSDGTTNTESCTRPPGYKVASELIALSGDCDDNNPNVNPGMKEVFCNGIDDDCNPATSDIPAVTLASPANAATNVSTTPTLSWNAVSCATSYGVQVATDQSFSSSTIVINESVTNVSFTVSTPLSNNATYYWHVNAKKDGEASAWSTAWSFTTTSLGPLDHITINPDPATIIVGGSQTYTATGYDQSNNSLGDVTSGTTFTISPDGSCAGATCMAIVAGTHTVTGNYAIKTDTATLYVNCCYNFTGFLSPVDNPPTLNLATAGQTIPVKWRLTTTNGAVVSDPTTFKNLISNQVTCGTAAPLDTIQEYTAGASGLQYLGNGNWQYNWKTSKDYRGNCRRMILNLNDGTQHSADFKFK